jgi:hypothetical protein
MIIEYDIQDVVLAFIGKEVLRTAKAINDVVQKIKKWDVTMVSFARFINQGGLKDEND